jgi:hypothetical protein
MGILSMATLAAPEARVKTPEPELAGGGGIQQKMAFVVLTNAPKYDIVGVVPRRRRSGGAPC